MEHVHFGFLHLPHSGMSFPVGYVCISDFEPRMHQSTAAISSTTTHDSLRQNRLAPLLRHYRSLPRKQATAHNCPREQEPPRRLRSQNWSTFPTNHLAPRSVLLGCSRLFRSAVSLFCSAARGCFALLFRSFGHGCFARLLTATAFPCPHA